MYFQHAKVLNFMGFLKLNIRGMLHGFNKKHKIKNESILTYLLVFVPVINNSFCTFVVAIFKGT